MQTADRYPHMKLKSSFCSIAYRNSQNLTIETILEQIQKAGYDGIELWWPHVEKLSKSQLSELRASAQQKNLSFSMLSPYLGNFNLPMTNRDEMIERTKITSETAVALGIPLLRTFAGWTCECSSLTASPEYWRYNLDGFKEMGRIADAHGLNIAIETHDQSLADSVDGVLRIIDAGGPRLKVNLQLDEIASNSKLPDGIAVYQKLKKHMVHMHTQPPFEEPQKAELRKLFSQMSNDGYAGYISIEHCAGKDDPQKLAVAGKETLKELLAEGQPVPSS
jgi:3-dehydroshikimate dehydratase